MKVEEPIDLETISLEALMQRIKDVEEEVYQFKKLGEDPTWAMLALAIESNAREVRKSKAGGVLRSVDDGLAHNYHCGIADGLDRAVRLRLEIVERVEQYLVELRALLKEKEDAKIAHDADESGRASELTDADLFARSHANGDASGEQFAP